MVGARVVFTDPSISVCVNYDYRFSHAAVDSKTFTEWVAENAAESRAPDLALAHYTAPWGKPPFQ